MKRAEAKKRYLYTTVQEMGQQLREAVHHAVEDRRADIEAAYYGFPGLPFLTDRDEEIWTPLFCVCKILCPERLDELTRAAADMSTEKTAEARNFAKLAHAEGDAEQDEYNRRLLLDMLAICRKFGRKSISTALALDELKALATGPWRKFRGDGLTANNLADMLDIFGVKPCNVRLNRIKGDGQKIAKGYKTHQLVEAAKKAGLESPSIPA